MTILPACPICELDELWLHRTEDNITVACYFCGWRCYITPANLDVLPTGVKLADAIAATVAAARAAREAADPIASDSE